MASAGGAWSRGGKFTKNSSRVNAIRAGRRDQAAKRFINKVRKTTG